MWNSIASWWSSPGSSATPPDPLPNLLPEDSIDDLRAKRMQLLYKIEQTKKEAKIFHSKNDKTRAMALMRQKQAYETQVTQYEGMIANMEKTSLAMDSVAVSAQVAQAMRSGTQQMRTHLKGITVNDIDTAVDDLDDVMRESSEVVQAISRPIGGELDEDAEAALMREMEEWDQEPAKRVPDPTPKKPTEPASVGGVGGASRLQLPDVPNTRIPVKNGGSL